MILLQFAQEDPTLRDELEADVREECVKLGPVDSVKVGFLYELMKGRESLFVSL